MKTTSISILIIILLIGTLTQISTDMYTPSLPGIAKYFQVDVNSSEATISLFVLGVSLTCLIYGPLSEIIGRRWALMIGILIAILGALICFFSPTIKTLQLGRFIQGCGLGSCTALWRSIFRDSYSGDELARIGSYLSNFVLLSVVLAPYIGGYIEQYTNWRITFIVLSAWSLIVLAAILFVFQETGEHHGAHRSNPTFILSTYCELLRCRNFMGFLVCSCLSYGGIIAWLTAGPIILIKDVGITPVFFGWLSIISVFAMAGGGALNGRIVKQKGSQYMIQLGFSIMMFSGILILLGYYLLQINLYAVFIPSVIFIFGSTLVFTNAFSNAFANIGHIAGYGGGLYSSIQLAGGAFFSGILAHLNTSNQLLMGLLFVASGLFSWIAFKTLVPKIQKLP